MNILLLLSFLNPNNLLCPVSQITAEEEIRLRSDHILGKYFFYDILSGKRLREIDNKFEVCEFACWTLVTPG